MKVRLWYIICIGNSYLTRLKNKNFTVIDTLFEEGNINISN